MQRIAVAAQRADGETVVRQLLLEVDQLRGLFEHRKLAVGITGIIAGAELHRIDVEALQLFQHVVKRHLRQKSGKNADSHVHSPSQTKNDTDRISERRGSATPQVSGRAAS